MRVFAKRELINNCICGVDIDPQAVEISRLSLSLKALESASVEPIAMLELGLLDSILLDGIGQNIKLGNSLVDSRINTYFDDLSQNDTAALRNLKIFDWKENFKFLNDKDGFDAIVGNPPYIEIKHYKKNSPLMHKYLSDSGDYSSCGSGKTDIAMPFIERSLNFLNSNGRLGFIVQTRFFKTDYGEYARKMLSDSRSIEEITDFGSLKVFEKRTTYTSIIILSKSNVKKLVYTKIDNLEQIEDKLLDGSKFNLINFTESNNLGKNPWFFCLSRSKKFACSTFKFMWNF
jgi:type II restriction/modification system DNA methylase subunit YeeA